MEKYNLKASLRTWQATFAGTATRTIILAVEWPDFGALSEAQMAPPVDAEVAKWLMELRSMGISSSDSLYRELGGE